MALLFPTFQSELETKLNKLSEINWQEYTHFLKGDVSGIQDFIFSVKSEKAAKTLKARSYFIQALSELCVKLIEDQLGAGNTKELYNGGGNFYLFAKGDVIRKLAEIREKINLTCQHDEYYVSLSVVDLKEATTTDFREIWQSIQEQSAKDKLVKYEGFSGVFDEYEASEAQKWELFTRRFVRSAGREINQYGNSSLPIKLDKGEMEVFGYTLELCETKADGCDDTSYRNSIVNKVPKWLNDLHEQCQDKINAYYAGRDDEKPKKGTEEVIEFHELTWFFAQQRTGTDKLAVLKMDVDNLGNLFNNFKEIKHLQYTSHALKGFFDTFMLRLWEQTFTWQEKLDDGTFQTRHEPFKNNIYVVFSGGDDCFLLGAWDAVFEFAARLQSEFKEFSSWLKSKVPTIAEAPTLSAGLIVVDPKYPVVRFAELAENSLKQAKNRKDQLGKPLKNAICVFGQVLTWDEFRDAQRVSGQLQRLIREKGESRAILERIKRSANPYEKLQKAAVRGHLPAPKVARLFYFLRNVKKENFGEVEELVKVYAKDLITAFQKRSTENVNPMKFPVAARWAEFLTR